jgi:putative transposase
METDWLLSHFGNEGTGARYAYNAFVMNGRGLLSPLREVRHQMLLGDSAFIERHINAAESDRLVGIVRAQRRCMAMSLEGHAAQYGRSDEAVARAYASTAYTMQQIADHFDISISTVGRIVKRFAV